MERSVASARMRFDLFAALLLVFAGASFGMLAGMSLRDVDAASCPVAERINVTDTGEVGLRIGYHGYSDGAATYRPLTITNGIPKGSSGQLADGHFYVTTTESSAR